MFAKNDTFEYTEVNENIVVIAKEFVYVFKTFEAKLFNLILEANDLSSLLEIIYATYNIEDSSRVEQETYEFILSLLLKKIIVIA